MRRRLDVELVRRGLAPSRTHAARLVAEGRITVAGAPADKPSRLVATGESVAVVAAEPYASRAGRKLAAALDHFAVDVAGRRVLDAGASTGGFTDVVLQRDAREVVAVDVGRGQLLTRLAADARVTVRDGTNVRHVTANDVGGPVDVVVADLSFISLRTVLDALVGLAAPGAHLVVLVKPQFEAGRREASRGKGVIRDPLVWGRVLREIRAAAGAAGARMVDVMASPVTGSGGNVEFPAHLVVGSDREVGDDALDAAVAAGGR